jgi:hypothetical protein
MEISTNGYSDVPAYSRVCTYVICLRSLYVNYFTFRQVHYLTRNFAQKYYLQRNYRCKRSIFEPAYRYAEWTISSLLLAFGMWSLRILINSSRGLRWFIVCAISAISINPSWVTCLCELTIRIHLANCSKS